MIELLESAQVIELGIDHDLCDDERGTGDDATKVTAGSENINVVKNA